MQFDFSDEQKELRNSVQNFLVKECPPSLVRAVTASEAGHSEALWAKIAETGYLAASIPEEYGGSGAGYLDLCIVAEECGRVLAPLPTVSSIYQVAEFLLLAGSASQKSKWLAKIAAAEAIGAVALNEGVGEIDPGRVMAQVRKGKLNGKKIPVADGLSADFAVVMARDDEDLVSLHVVELQNEGVTRSPVKTIDQSRKHARLEFCDAPAEPLGTGKEGWGLLERVRDRAAVLTAFEQVGGSDRSLLIARDYALHRYAFGRPIGSFQAVKHMLADVYVANELARSNAYYGAWALAADSDRLPLAAAGARVSATQAYQLASASNIHVHGGMGFTWEFDCHLYYRRSNYLALTLGGLSLWENRLIEQMQSHVPEQGRKAS